VEQVLLSFARVSVQPAPYEEPEAEWQPFLYVPASPLSLISSMIDTPMTLDKKFRTLAYTEQSFSFKFKAHHFHSSLNHVFMPYRETLHIH
jgi:hypothetical protein